MSATAGFAYIGFLLFCDPHPVTDAPGRGACTQLTEQFKSYDECKMIVNTHLTRIRSNSKIHDDTFAQGKRVYGECIVFNVTQRLRP